MSINKEIEVNVEGFEKGFQVLVNKYLFQLDDYNLKVSFNVEVTIDIYCKNDSEDSFIAEADTLIRSKNGYYEEFRAFGDSEEYVVTEVLEKFINYLRKNYPNNIPDYAFKPLLVDYLEFDMENCYFPEKITIDKTWRSDKVQRNIKTGPYLEFQLENNGSYKYWSDNSIFIGLRLFNLVYDTFCKANDKFNKYDFDTSSTNLFIVSELAKLKENIINKIELLESISSLSEYVEILGNPFDDIDESGNVVWKEVCESIMDFLFEVLKLIDLGIEEERVLFVLGLKKD